MASFTGSYLGTYVSAVERMLDGAIDADGDTYGVLLTTNAHTPSITDAVVSDLDNETAVSGYSRVTGLSGATTISGSEVRFSVSGTVEFTPSSDMTVRYWHVYSNANGSDATRELIAWGELDGTPGDVTTTGGNTLTVTLPTTLITFDTAVA